MAKKTIIPAIPSYDRGLTTELFKHGAWHHYGMEDANQNSVPAMSIGTYDEHTMQERSIDVIPAIQRSLEALKIPYELDVYSPPMDTVGTVRSGRIETPKGQYHVEITEIIPPEEAPLISQLKIIGPADTEALDKAARDHVRGANWQERKVGKDRPTGYVSLDGMPQDEKMALVNALRTLHANVRYPENSLDVKENTVRIGAVDYDRFLYDGTISKPEPEGLGARAWAGVRKLWAHDHK